MREPLLELNALSLSFRRYDGGLQQHAQTMLRSLDLDVAAGEVVAVVGASGSGKSLLAAAILGILPENAQLAGEMRYRGAPLTAERQAALRGREMALVPQSVAFLDPLMRAGAQLGGTVEKRREILARLGLDARVERLYPFQLSGGMARRVLVATALLSEAALIIADEPTPGMDLEQALAALGAFREMADAGAGVILITHDLSLAVAFADRVAVFYAGTTVELCAAEDFHTGRLRHPYTQALWQALPQNGFVPLAGSQPAADEVTAGCAFAPRCPHAAGRCRRETPPFLARAGGKVRCFDGT